MTRESPITTIAFDADDTLWQNEQYFRITQDRFAALLKDYADSDHLAERLNEAERRNVRHYGFGIKGFTLSMIETAIEVTDERVPATILHKILEAGREMLSHPLELLPGAREVIEGLRGRYRILLVTKGDLFDQERKVAQSGLAEMFDAVEIVSDKVPEVYERVFSQHGTGAGQGMMVGNSLKSDVIPAIEAGAWGIHIPHDLTWVFEAAEKPSRAERFREIESLMALPGLIAELTE
jgi:putative hydrolase of the HAD superfamily